VADRATSTKTGAWPAYMIWAPTSRCIPTECGLQPGASWSETERIVLSRVQRQTHVRAADGFPNDAANPSPLDRSGQRLGLLAVS